MSDGESDVSRRGNNLISNSAVTNQKAARVHHFRVNALTVKCTMSSACASVTTGGVLFMSLLLFGKDVVIHI